MPPAPDDARLAPAERRSLVAVFAIALVVRAAYLLSIERAYFFHHPLTEAARYGDWALAIVHGTAPLRPPLDEAIGYPYLVAALFHLFGPDAGAVAVAQALLDACTCVAVAWVARRLVEREQRPVVGTVAGLIAALYGPMIYFSGEVLPASLCLFAVAVAMVATPADAAASASRWLSAGTAWAATLLVRSEIAVALPVIALHAALTGGRRAATRFAAAPALLLAASLAINWSSSGHPVLLTTGAGANLWLGNNPGADGVNPFLHGPLVATVDEVGRRAHNAIEADVLLRERALDFFAREPATAAGLVGRKFLLTLVDRELPNTSDIDWETAQSGLFHRPWFPISFGMVLPLALAGACAFGHRLRNGLWFAAPLIVGLATCTVFFTNARFRLVIVLTLIPLAAVALAGLPRLLRDATSRRAAVAARAAAITLGVVLAYVSYGGGRGYAIAQIDANTATLERGMGQPDEAVRLLERAVVRDPSDAPAWIELGLALQATGRLGEASSAWSRAQRALPDDLEIRRYAARFRRAHGTPRMSMVVAAGR